MKKPTEQNYAYLAGLVDGEGHVKLTKNTCCICIEMKHEPTIDWLVTTFGGNKGTYVRTRAKGTYTLHRWVVEARPLIIKLLPHIIQYSVTKQQQLKVLQEALDIKGRKHFHLYDRALRNIRQREKDVND